MGAGSKPSQHDPRDKPFPTHGGNTADGTPPRLTWGPNWVHQPNVAPGGSEYSPSGHSDGKAEERCYTEEQEFYLRERYT